MAASKFDSQKGSLKIDHNFGNGHHRLTGAFDKIAATGLNPGLWSGPIATGAINDNPGAQNNAVMTTCAGKLKDGPAGFVPRGRLC